MSAARRRTIKRRRIWEKGYRLRDEKLRSSPSLIEMIPEGVYCYRDHNLCPFWGTNPKYDSQFDGYCSLLEIGDWMIGAGLLWDQVKECGLKKGRQNEI